MTARQFENASNTFQTLVRIISDMISDFQQQSGIK